LTVLNIAVAEPMPRATIKIATIGEAGGLGEGAQGEAEIVHVGKVASSG